MGVRLKADPTAKYLVFVLSVEQGVERGDMVVSVAEFATPSLILSFGCE
jgi:hypothetical protein